MPVQWAPGYTGGGAGDDVDHLDADVESLVSDADTVVTAKAAIAASSSSKKSLKSSKSCCEVGIRGTGEASFIPSREYHQQMHARAGDDVESYDGNAYDYGDTSASLGGDSVKTCRDLGARGAMNVGGTNREVVGPRLHLDGDGEPCLNTRLLKERLEMEVGLSREGVRAVVFMTFMTCFAAALFLSVQPTQRSGPRWFLSRTLKLKDYYENVGSPEDAYDTIREVASSAREFFPLSSRYLGDTLSRALIRDRTSFPAGPIELPTTAQPRLLLEWSMSVRLLLQDPDDLTPKKMPIVRQFLPGDRSGYSCWGWYSQGMYKYFLEYGRHDLDNGYNSIELAFDPEKTQTDVRSMNLVALRINTTHASILLQDGGEVSQPLPKGVPPTECPGGLVRVGDRGLTIAGLTYHPWEITPTQFVDIQEGGQTLSSLAAGVAPVDVRDEAGTDMAGGLAETQDLIRSYGEDLLSVAKLEGSLSQMEMLMDTIAEGDMLASDEEVSQPSYPGAPSSPSGPSYPGAPDANSSSTPPSYPGAPSSSAPSYPGAPSTDSAAPSYPGAPSISSSPAYPGPPDSDASTPAYPGAPSTSPPTYPGAPDSDTSTPAYPGAPSISTPAYPGAPSTSTPANPGAPDSDASTPAYPGAPSTSTSPAYPGAPSTSTPTYPGAYPGASSSGSTENGEYEEIVSKNGMDIKFAQFQQFAVGGKLKSAFSKMRDAEQWTFSMAWWSKGDAAGDGIVTLRTIDLGFLDRSDPNNTKTKFSLDYMGSASMKSWIMLMNTAPFCSNGPDEYDVCLKSPNQFCQAPEDGGYDGIWRHYVLRFGYATRDHGQRSEMELFLDGVSLCGFSFAADLALIPHNIPGDGFTMMAGIPIGALTPGQALFSWKDFRIYPRLITNSEITALATDETMMECTSVEVNTDDPEYRTEFGQSCVELSEMSLSSTPIACQTDIVKEKCPISCKAELPPTCFSGMPVPPKPGSAFSKGARFPMAAFVDTRGKSSSGTSSFAAAYAIEKTDEQWDMLYNAAEWLDGDMGGEWTLLYDTIAKVDYAVVATSLDAVENSAVDEDGMPLIWISSKNESDMGWCRGARLDETITGFGGAQREIGQLCDAELAYHTAKDKITKRQKKSYDAQMEVLGLDALPDPRTMKPTEVMNLGWSGTGFRPGLMGLNQSATMYFWAKTSDIEDGSAPKLTATDSDHNMCFIIEGRSAVMYKFGEISRFESWLAENPEALNEIGGGVDINGGDLGLLEQWKASKKKITMPEEGGVMDQLKEDEWVFFALSIDREANKARYAINGYVMEETIEGGYGCNSLQYLVNTGPDMVISPIRVTPRALPKGSLQELYILSRPIFNGVVTGPDISRMNRVRTIMRPSKKFTRRTVALSPPILVQRRVVAPSDGSSSCKGEIAQQYNQRQRLLRERMCRAPFECMDDDVAEVTCLSNDMKSPERFFGRNPIEQQGKEVFPEFAWTLENSVIVRDQKEIVPAEEYIDASTLEVKMFMAFFTPSSQVATMIELNFDMASTRVYYTSKFRQIKILDGGEFSTVLAWLWAAFVVVLLSAALALPAAHSEIIGAVTSIRLFIKRKIRNIRFMLSMKHSPEEMTANAKLHHQESTRRPRTYSADTTQPDVVDVIFCILVAIVLVFQVSKLTYAKAKATEAFGDMTTIDWSADNLTFNEKVTDFLSAIGRAIEVTADEEYFLTVIFWVLVFCSVRLILYMKIHPSISSITNTFESVGLELVNFLFSFGIIFLLLAYIAHVRFGFLYDEYSTYRSSLIMQFSILIGDETPDYSTDPLMCIYLVSFVFVCTLSLLNFMLAIVVNGYTKVTERLLENQVAQALFVDMLSVPVDMCMWMRHRSWPSRVALLNVLSRTYPRVFESEDEILQPLSRRKFQDIVKEAASHSQKVTPDDADMIFKRYQGMSSLLLKY